MPAARSERRPRTTRGDAVQLVAVRQPDRHPQVAAQCDAAYAAPKPSAPTDPVGSGIPAYGLFTPTPAADPLVCLSMGFHRSAPVGLHDSRITSVLATIDHPIPADIFDFWLKTLIALRGPDILRIKVIVHVEGLPHPFAFHAVQHILHPPVSLPHWSDGDRTNRIVDIGRDIPRDILAGSLDVLQVRPTPTKAGGKMAQTISMPF